VGYVGAPDGNSRGGNTRFAPLPELWENPIMFLDNTGTLIRGQAFVGQQAA
jgi:hypothetical protein